MASTVGNSPITNLVPVWSSDDDREKLLQFRSIERTGYLTVTELVRDFLYDATQEQALTIVNVAVTETHLSNANAKVNSPQNFVQNTTLDPTQPKFLSQRIRLVNTSGAGYNVGDVITHFVVGASANVQMVVTEVDTDGVKGVKSFEILNSGTYNTTVNPLGSNKRMEFRRRLNSKATLVKALDYSYDKWSDGNLLIFQGRHTGNGYVGGTQPGPTPYPAFAGPVETQTYGQPYSRFWEDSFTTSGMPSGRGGIANTNSTSPYTITTALTAIVNNQTATRWPSDGLWANISVENNGNLFVGSEIMLRPGAANVTSVIPAGTLITRVEEIEVVTGLTSKTRSGVNQPTDYFETTNKYIWFTTSNPVTVDKGDQFYLRGNGFTFTDNVTTGDTAEVFTVITEAKARIDPLASDRQPVTANISSINGKNVRLTNIRHGWVDWAPSIFEGMTITHGLVDTNGATVANIANIQYSKTIGATTANIVTDVELPSSILASPAGNGITFAFNTTQNYRIAFEANGKQTLAIYAATSVQLRDDNKIARVTDYTGSVTDLSGVMGDVPSIPVISNVSPNALGGERLTNVTGNVQVPFNVNSIYNANITSSGRAEFIVTAYTGNALIQPGYVVDLHANGNIKLNTTIESQVTPLRAGEKPGGIGRYIIANNVTYTGNIPITTNLTVGKVIDRKIDVTDITQGFVNRSLRVAQHPESYPLSYFASFTNRGMFFGIWEGTWSIMQKTRARQLSERDAWFSWFLIQRPVNRKTGQVRTTGQSPVFCINSVGYKYWKFIVRERDVMHPTQGDAATTAFYYDDLTNKVVSRPTPYRVPADAHTEDSHGILNTTHQIALTEDSKYLVSFLYNLTTPRFRYSDELDMVGQTAGDVSMASSDIKITAYSEATQRVYKALSANLPYNAGLRVCVIKDIYTA